MKIKKVFVNFCENTNIHGFNYITQPKRWKIEQLFWLLSIFTSTVLTGSLIRKLLLENLKNPTIIFTDQDVVYVTDIFFPSVSLTPGLILKTPEKTGIDYVAIKEKLINNEICLENLTLNELKRLQIASLIARDNFMSDNFNVSIPTDDFIKRMRDDFPEFWLLNDLIKVEKTVIAIFSN